MISQLLFGVGKLNELCLRRDEPLAREFDSACVLKLNDEAAHHFSKRFLGENQLVLTIGGIQIFYTATTSVTRLPPSLEMFDHCIVP